MKRLPAVERVRELLDYEAETGLLRWKNPSGRYGRYPAGSVAGWQHPEGYRYVRIDGVSCRVSRLAWLHVHGEWPAEQIDHKNCDASDDRLDNLRPATQMQNQQNRPLMKTNTSGFKCVFYDKVRDQWIARITINGKRKWLRRYDTPEEAYASYCAAIGEAHGEFSRPDRRS